MAEPIKYIAETGEHGEVVWVWCSHSNKCVATHVGLQSDRTKRQSEALYFGAPKEEIISWLKQG